LSEDIIDGHSTCKYGACTIGIISSGAASGSVFKYDACTIGIVSSCFASGSAFNYDACTIGIFPSGFASGSACDYKYVIVDIQCFFSRRSFFGGFFHNLQCSKHIFPRY
jgi:hypothetical protein